VTTKTKLLSSAADILGIADIQTEEVFVKPWNASVRVRGLTAAERDVFEASVIDRRSGRVNPKDIRARLVVMCLVDEKGERIFSDSHVPDLAKKSAAALDPIFAAAQRLSGMTKADIEELEGN